MLKLFKNGADPGNVKKVISRYLKDGAQNPDVILCAKGILESSVDDPIVSVYKFAKENIVYIPDPGPYKDKVPRPDETELFIAPWKMVELIWDPASTAVGDCDDFAIFVATILRTLNYRSRVVLLAVHDEDYDHASAQVWMDGAQQWVFIDPTNVSNPMGWVIGYNKIMAIE
jgi:hypothetical protein